MLEHVPREKNAKYDKNVSRHANSSAHELSFSQCGLPSNPLKENKRRHARGKTKQNTFYRHRRGRSNGSVAMHAQAATQTSVEKFQIAAARHPSQSYKRSKPMS
jgi:hypothetical protein